MKFSVATCLAAVQYLLLMASPAQAMPTPTGLQQTNEVAAASDLSDRNIGAGKRIVLWEWTNSRDVSKSAALRKSASKLEVSSTSEFKAAMNWETWRPSELPDSLDFQPMVRTPAQAKGDAWKNLLATVDAARRKDSKKRPMVHFYNEPEYNGISAADAAKTWKSVMLPLRRERDVRLVGPAVSSSPEGAKWLADFMSRLTGADEKPTYIGAHFYTNQRASKIEGEISAAKKHLSGLIARYGLKLVVSEIACTSRDADDVWAFTKAMADWMDREARVKMYGFFGVSRKPTDSFVSPQAQLLDSQGNWTELGKYLGGW